MKFCKRCWLHILSNTCLAALIFSAVYFTLNLPSISYELIVCTIVLIIIKSWADKTLGDLAQTSRRR